MEAMDVNGCAEVFVNPENLWINVRQRVRRRLIGVGRLRVSSCLRRTTACLSFSHTSAVQIYARVWGSKLVVWKVYRYVQGFISLLMKFLQIEMRKSCRSGWCEGGECGAEECHMRHLQSGRGEHYQIGWPHSLHSERTGRSAHCVTLILTIPFLKTGKQKVLDIFCVSLSEWVILAVGKLVPDCFWKS